MIKFIKITSYLCAFLWVLIGLAVIFLDYEFDISMAICASVNSILFFISNALNINH